MKHWMSLALLVGASAVAPVCAGAQNLSGTVMNKTVNKPAAGDTVTLIKLSQGMQEGAHTTTDARGHFTLPMDDPGMHLVRVTHEKANYFRPVPPGTKSADISVYDAAAKVDGVTGAADILRMEANGNSLEVTELFAIDNNSSPPRTQFSERSFELYLPANAEVTGGAALGPGSMPVQSAPVPLGEPGHYAFIFPLRPGETRFQVLYKVPYSGKMSFTPRLSMPFANFAVMLPKTMQFSPGASMGFKPESDDTSAQIFLAKDVTAGQALGFTVSGTGQLPAEPTGQNAGPGGAAGGADAGAAGPEAGASGAAQQQDNRPGGGLGNPEDKPDALHAYRWWVLGGIAALFVGGIWFAMRKPARGPSAEQIAFSREGVHAAHMGAQNAAKGPRNSVLLDALKDELFALETDRLEGRISDEDYATEKAALETVLRRALSRSNAASKRSAETTASIG
jgi:hypothetical protein